MWPYWLLNEKNTDLSDKATKWPTEINVSQDIAEIFILEPSFNNECGC